MQRQKGYMYIPSIKIYGLSPYFSTGKRYNVEISFLSADRPLFRFFFFIFCVYDLAVSTLLLGRSEVSIDSLPVGLLSMNPFFFALDICRRK